MRFFRTYSSFPPPPYHPNTIIPICSPQLTAVFGNRYQSLRPQKTNGKVKIRFRSIHFQNNEKTTFLVFATTSTL